MKYCAPVGDSVGGKDRPGCLLTGLQYEFDILKDHNRPAAERATALRYVIHFIGDLHQPLHTTTNDDQGGNCTSLTLFEGSDKANLHGVWDYGIIAHELAEKHQTPQQLAEQLDQEHQSKGKKWLNQPLDVASPQNSEAVVKTITPVTKTRRRPNLSATLPPSMRNPPKNNA